MRILIALLMFLVALPAAATGDDTNPYALYYGTVQRVIDGDTIVVRFDLWPGLTAEFAVRVRGIAAPELRRVGCEAEREWGEEARAKVEELYEIGRRVRLEDVELDSFGRALANVSRYRSDRWLQLADELVSRRLAVLWVPGMDDVPWCLLAQTR
jgi:endonuclease YncB( thermonuclease family)